MQKIECFDFVIEYLKEKAILTTDGKDRFVLIKNSVRCLKNGSSYVIPLDDFKDIYKDSTFYIYEDESVYIDDHKDDDYYRYYKK